MPTIPNASEAAIVLWGRGDLARIRDAQALATQDWRDVLLRAELANDDWRDKLDAQLGHGEVSDGTS